MRDISRRIKRYRLSRYALPDDPVRRHFKWVWVLAFGWVAWAGFISEHSLYRIWRLDQESKQTTSALAETQRQREILEEEQRDPEARRQNAERILREENGMAGPNEIIYQIRDDVPADSLGR
jgi:cell division protein FtsB